MGLQKETTQHDAISDTKFVIVSVILLLLGSIGIFLYFCVHSDSGRQIHIAEFPKTIGAWHSQDIPLTGQVYELLETDNLILRNYTNAQDKTVNLYIIYSDDNRKVSHPPEICLQGEGETITEREFVRITNTLTATKLIIEKRELQELVVFWYKAGNTNTNSYLRQQLNVVLNRMKGKPTSVALIRVMASVDKDSPESTFATIKAFCRQIEPILQEYMP